MLRRKMTVGPHSTVQQTRASAFVINLVFGLSYWTYTSRRSCNGSEA
jgi:hypothetical protein